MLLHFHLFVVNKKMVVFKAIFKWFFENRSIFYILKVALF